MNADRVDAAAAPCEHRQRRREIHLGFASAETVCTACGQAFDPDREQELRRRDRGAAPESRTMSEETPTWMR